MAICHRSEVRVYDRTGTGSYTVLPAQSVSWSWKLGGDGFLSLQAESRAAPLAANPTLLDDCVIKVALPLSEPGTTLTEVAVFAARGRAGTLWDGAGRQVREVRAAPTLYTVWSQAAILHPEGNTIAQMAAPERYFGWMSTIYDPADDPGQWGTPSANAGTQATAAAPRAGNPVDWPTELGGAYWITRGTLANGTRHLFIADCVVPTASFIGLWVSSDETVAAYFGGSLVAQTSSSETGYTSFEYWQGQVAAGRYRVALDKTSVVSRGGDGRDPVLLAVATLDDTGAPDDILLLTNTTDWQIYTTDPVYGSVPSLTPGAIVTELASQAAARGSEKWAALTLDFDADSDSDNLPWPVREERVWRIAYDRHLDMIEGLGDLGFCPEVTPGLVFKAWSDRGTDRSDTVTLATLDEVDSVAEAGVPVAGTYMPVETQDGWVVVENPAAQTEHGRWEVGLSLGNAPSIAQGRRLGQKVLDDRLSRPESEWTVEFYARTGSVPFTDFWVGDTVMVSINGTPTPRVVLDLAAEQDHTEAIVRWTARTGDVARVGRFGTEPSQALAAGGIGSFVVVPDGGALFSTMAGEATASGGVGEFNDGSALFLTESGDASATGGVGRFTDGSAVFETVAGEATADGGVGSLSSDSAASSSQLLARIWLPPMTDYPEMMMGA